MSRSLPLAAAGLLALATSLPPPPIPPAYPPPPIHRHLSSRQESSPSLQFLVTGYCPCRACCGKEDGITATGRPARAGRTVAVDPACLPYGTRIRVEGLGERVAEDTGGLLHGRRLDVFFPTHAQALAFGRRWLTVEILPAAADGR